MTTAITTGNLLNPSAQGLTCGMYPAGNLSQYMEGTSIFNSGFTSNIGNVGFGYGYGLGNDAVYNYAEHALDNQTALTFAQQGNQFALNSYNQIMTKEIPAMANAIREGEFGKAAQIYREIYDAMSQKNGEELTEQSQRVKQERAIKATITNMYRQITGSELAKDINEAGEGYFKNGFMQAITLGNHHKTSAEETISYMTGESIEGYSSKKFQKTLGKVVGGGLIAGALGVATWLCPPVGIAAAVVTGACALFGGKNTTETVTEA